MAVKDSKGNLKHLSAKHRRQLEEESSIAPDIIEERGVRTITQGRELPKDFSCRQRRRAPGTLFTVHRPNGETSHSFRPDEPDPKSLGHKYEQPSKHYGGPGNVLDVHPSCRHLIDDPSIPVIFVEGIKKGDAILSAARAAGIEVLVVVISGVWNWLSEGESIPDMFDVPVEGRQVSICFDSDMLNNPSVQLAVQRLAEHHISREAKVWITYLPDQPDGSKMGADDFFVNGGTFPELRLLTRRYDPADFATVRLSRDKRLRLAIEDLQGKFWDSEWRSMGGHTDRDVYLKLIETARRHGKVVDDGVRVTISHGTLQIEAKIGSSRTLCKAINRLEEVGLMYRDNDDRKPDKSGSFVLRASVKYYGEGEGKKETTTPEPQEVYARTLHSRVPRLRWSRPKVKPSRNEIRAARKGERQALPEPKPGIQRIGKIRGAILDALDAAGGTATLQELADVLHRKRPRDIRKRNLPMLEEAGILAVAGDIVCLTENWRKNLNEVRFFDEELEADEVARRRLALKRRAYHTRHERKADQAPTPEEMDARRREGAAKMRAAALAAFQASGSGAARNLALFMDGEVSNVEYLVKSVLAYLGKSFAQWERWRDPVLEAAAARVREHASVPDPPEDPVPAYRSHSLDCECFDCSIPEPRYARLYRRGVA
jgi:hypothetical protein